MRKITFLACSIFFHAVVIAQNVGIGTPSPDHRLHVSSTSAAVAKFENTTSMAGNITTDVYLKTGGLYTAAFKGIGTGINSARLGLFTFASISPAGLQERLSILDNGNVGIGTLTPTARFEVSGTTKLGQVDVAGKTRLVQGTADAALEVDGKIKTSGTSRAAFIYTVDAGDLSNGGKTLTIDHPFANNDPNALLFITAREMTIMGMGFSVRYNATTRRWQMLTDNATFTGGAISSGFMKCDDSCGSVLVPSYDPNKFSLGDKFNILIISQ